MYRKYLHSCGEAPCLAAVTLSLCCLALLCVASLGQAATTDGPAELIIGRTAIATSPERYGINFHDEDYNSYTKDPGMEPCVIRRYGIANDGDAISLQNNNFLGSLDYYQTLADGFFEGATVRVYRVVGGVLQPVRTGTVAQYNVAFNRVNTTLVRPGSSFTVGGLTPGATYYFVVRAVDTSNHESANSNEAIAVPLAGTTSGDTGNGAYTYTGTDQGSPAAPTGLVATAIGGGVSLDWTDNTDSDLAGYNVYISPHAPADRYRIVFDAPGPEIEAGDVYFLDMEVDNAPLEKMNTRMAFLQGQDTWRAVGGSVAPYGLPVTKYRDSSTRAPENGGKSSLVLQAPGAHEVSLRQSRFVGPTSPYTNVYATLEPGRTYRLEAWLKQSGIASGSATVRFGPPWNGLSQTWTGITGEWQRFRWDFVAPAYPATSDIVEIQLAFAGPGTLWIDNFLAYDPALAPYALRPAALEELVEFRPGCIRLRCGHTDANWGTTLEDATNADPVTNLQFHASAGRRPAQYAYKIPQGLEFCRQSGATPWLVIGSYFDEQEWRNLMEYLAAPYDPDMDTSVTKPYAFKRYMQGQQAPWTDVFPKIRLEYGNEAWNPLFTFIFPTGTLHGQLAEYFFQQAKGSAYYPAVAGQMDFIVNGWMLQGDANGYGHAAATAAPSATYMDVAAYIGGFEANIDIGGGELNDEGFSQYMLYTPSMLRYFFNMHISTRDTRASQGRVYGIANYEAGPGYQLPDATTPFDPVQEAYGKSLAAGVATLDAFLYNSSRGVDPQAYFIFRMGYNWSSHSLVEQGYRGHPSWLALKLRNLHARGSFVDTAIAASPTADIPAPRAGVPAFPSTPLVVPYAMREGDRWSVFVLSRKVNGATPVTLRLPFDSITSGTLYTLTGDPRATNIDAENVAIQSQAISGFSRDYSFSMPPGSIYLFVFQAAPLAAESNPSCSVVTAPGQLDPTADAPLRYSIRFSAPVSGFEADDVVIGGSANPRFVSIAEIEPYAGTNFEATVSGMTRGGTVTLTVPAGVAMSTSGGLANLASTSTDNAIEFQKASNVILCHDDFALAPETAPFPPFLHAVASGSGWATGWAAMNFNAATYGDGYKLGTAAPLGFGTLVTTGSYCIGARASELASRQLDVAGAFADFMVPASSPAVVGASGTTLYFSALLRKDTNDNDAVLVRLANNSLADSTSERVSIGYFGAASNTGPTRYWGFQVRNAANTGFDVVKSDVPVVVGEPVLLVLKMEFGATDTFTLFANPLSLGGMEPTVASASFTTTGATDVVFRSLGLQLGVGTNRAAVDEIRFSDTFAGATPTTAAGAAVNGWVLY